MKISPSKHWGHRRLKENVCISLRRYTTPLASLKLQNRHIRQNLPNSMFLEKKKRKRRIPHNQSYLVMWHII